MRNRDVAGIAILAALLFAGWDNFRYREPGATTTTSEHEISGTNSPDDLDPLTAERYIDDVRLGHAVDPEGMVPPEQQTAVFGPNDVVHLSMEVTDAPAGSEVRLSVYDSATNELVWSAHKRVQPGRSYLDFVIDEDLARGSYQARVIIGDETAANRPFSVVERPA